MAICAYCDEDRPPTREHIWPDWLLKRTDYSVAYGARANRLVGRDQTVKDVCETCNNVHLGRLDGYAKTLFDRYIQHWVEEDQIVDFHYDHGLLLRWLLKVAYNSARTTGQDAALLAKYRQVLIAEDPCTPLFAFGFVSTIMPAHVIDPGATTFRRIDPKAARCGRLLIPEFQGDPRFAIRMITINSYFFSLLIVDDTDLAVDTFAAVADRLLGQPLQPDGFTRVSAPSLNALQAMRGMESWPGLASRTGPSMQD